MKRLVPCLLLALLVLAGMAGQATAQERFERTIVVRIDQKLLVPPKMEVLDKNLVVLATFPVAAASFPLDLPIEGVVKWVEVNPTWRPTKRTRADYERRTGKELPESIPPGDPLNALGIGFIHIDFKTPWVEKKGLATMGFHSTNAPKSIGKYVSRGCVRMFADDWKRLALLIKGIRTRVLFVPMEQAIEDYQTTLTHLAPSRAPVSCLERSIKS